MLRGHLILAPSTIIFYSKSVNSCWCVISVNSKHICCDYISVALWSCCATVEIILFEIDFMHYIAHTQIPKNLLADSSHPEVEKRPHIAFFYLCMKHEVNHEHAAILYTCTFRVLPLCLHSSDWSHRGEKKTEVVMTTAPFSVTHK